jgi:hypothetical protein
MGVNGFVKSGPFGAYIIGIYDQRREREYGLHTVEIQNRDYRKLVQTILL